MCDWCYTFMVHFDVHCAMTCVDVLCDLASALPQDVWCTCVLKMVGEGVLWESSGLQGQLALALLLNSGHPPEFLVCLLLFCVLSRFGQTTIT